MKAAKKSVKAANRSLGTKALAVEDGEVLFWTEEQWWKMTNEHPLMMQDPFLNHRLSQ